MLDILKYCLSGFWVFVGSAILLNGFAYFFVNMILRIWARLLRAIMVFKHGWPPDHLDADGDFIPNKDGKA